MRIERRRVMAGATAVMATGVGRAARAEAYPSRPVRLIVGVSAGGSADFAARVVAEGLRTRLGQPVVVENRTGAVGAIAFDYVARAVPDGYTLAFPASAGISLLAAVRPDLPYDITRAFTYICRAVTFDWVLVVSKGAGFSSLSELVDHARANPGKIMCGTIGVGSATHLAALLLEQQTGIKVTTVPYNGGSQVLPDLVAGRIDMAFLTVQDGISNPDATRLLAITGTAREPTLPAVPTMAEAGYPGAAMTMWLGLAGPAGLPAEVTDRLAGATQDVLKDAAVQQRFLTLGFRPAPLAGTAFRQMVVDEYARWRQVAQTAHFVIR